MFPYLASDMRLPLLGHEASAGVVPISGDEKTAVFLYEVGLGEGEVAFTRIVV